MIYLPHSYTPSHCLFISGCIISYLRSRDQFSRSPVSHSESAEEFDMTHNLEFAVGVDDVEHCIGHIERTSG